jgi:hypothetical protein
MLTGNGRECRDRERPRFCGTDANFEGPVGGFGLV